VSVVGSDTGHVEAEGVGEPDAPDALPEGAGGLLPEAAGGMLPEAAGTFAVSSGSGFRIPAGALGRAEENEEEVPRPKGLVETGEPGSGAAMASDLAEGADRPESTTPRRPEGPRGRPNLRRSTIRSTTSARV
jgi:hypothetical protein